MWYIYTFIDGSNTGIFSSVNPVDEILVQGGESPAEVLAKLLEESELLQEVKGQNQKLLDFLSSEEILRALIGEFLLRFDHISHDQIVMPLPLWCR